MNPTHKRRARHAEALQFNADNIQVMLDKLHTIDGVSAQAYKGNDRMILVRQDTGSPYMQSIYTLYTGDWLVTGENGLTKRYTDDQFLIKYEVI